MWSSRNDNINIQRRPGAMLLNESVTSTKLCLCTKIRDLRLNKQKTIPRSIFEAHFRRFPKTELKIKKKVKFLTEPRFGAFGPRGFTVEEIN